MIESVDKTIFEFPLQQELFFLNSEVITSASWTFFCFGQIQVEFDTYIKMASPNDNSLIK